MASLANTIKRRDQGLAETSLEELSAQTGRAAPPVQPLEAGVIGANPDQAKMAGVKGQKASALRSAIQGGDDLATTTRRQQSRTTQTEAEKAKSERATAAAGLGDLGSRVQELADKNISNTLAGREDIQLQQLSEDPETQDLLARIQADPLDAEAVLALNTKLGLGPDEKPMSAADIMAKFASVTDLVGEAVAGGLDMTVGGLNFEELGYTGASEVAELLGINEEDFQGMSVPELLQQIDNMVQKDFDEVNSLQQQMADPNLGPAERSEVRAQLRELGAVGVRKAESTAEELTDAIEGGDVVNVFGEDVSVKDMMDDSYMSGVVASYFLKTEDEKAEFDKENPELAEFIKHYEDELQVATEDMDEGVVHLSGEKAKDDSFKDTTGFDDELMDGLTNGAWSDPNRGESVVAGLEEQYPAVVLIGKDSTLGDVAKASLKANLKVVQDLSPEFTKEFLGMTEFELKALGAFDPASPEWQSLINILDQDRVISKINPNDANTIANAFDEKLDGNGLSELVDDIKAAINLGEIPASALDGIPGLKDKQWGKVAAWMSTQAPGSLAEAANMKGLKDHLAGIQSSAGKLADVALPDSVKNVFTRNPVMAGNLMWSILDDMEPEDTANLLTHKAANPTLYDDDAKNAINVEYKKDIYEDMSGQLSSTSGFDFDTLISSIEDIDIETPLTAEQIEEARTTLLASQIPPLQKKEQVTEMLATLAAAQGQREKDIRNRANKKNREIATEVLKEKVTKIVKGVSPKLEEAITSGEIDPLDVDIIIATVAGTDDISQLSGKEKVMAVKKAEKLLKKDKKEKIKKLPVPKAKPKPPPGFNRNRGSKGGSGGRFGRGRLK